MAWLTYAAITRSSAVPHRVPTNLDLHKTMRVRRCNAKCYAAKGNDCSCQCNGVNHGVGAQQARENTHKLGLLWSIPSHRAVCPRSRKRAAHPGQASLFSSL